MLYCATLPSYDSEKTKAGKHGNDDVIKADDPNNKNKLHEILSLSQ